MAEGCSCVCAEGQKVQASVSEGQLREALSTLKRACAQRNDCTAEEELQAVEKILFGVASSLITDKEDEGFLNYIKSRISLGLRVLTGSYDVGE